MYRGDFTALTPGLHQFSVKSDAGTVIEFAVTEAKFELGETAMNEALLKQMAELSGGGFFREETLAKLPETDRGEERARARRGFRAVVVADLFRCCCSSRRSSGTCGRRRS